MIWLMTWYFQLYILKYRFSVTDCLGNQHRILTIAHVFKFVYINQRIALESWLLINPFVFNSTKSTRTPAILSEANFDIVFEITSILDEFQGCQNEHVHTTISDLTCQIL